MLVYPPKPGDFTIGFVDWTPQPPDKNMGLFREVKIKTSGKLSINKPFVTTKVKLETLDEASVTISAEVMNHSDESKTAVLTGTIGQIIFEKSFAIKPDEAKQISFTPQDYPVLKIKNPKLWWPVGYGEPNLYNLNLSIKIDSRESDVKQLRFGIREVSDYFNSEGYRGYKVNGKKILLRGGGWMDDLFLNENADNIESQMKYVRHMNLNTVRLEGFWGSSQKLYDMADQYGILLMAGWSCQWEWENYLGKQTDEDYGGILTSQDFDLIIKYMNDQVLWLRNHPSVLVWVVGSDMLPKPELEKRYVELFKSIDPTRPYLSCCKSRMSEISGESGVKMNGPYDYVTPNYWYEDNDYGGAFGFNTETGPGPQIPPMESLKKMIPDNSLWPINDYWNYHCARGEFDNIDIYKKAFDKRYGEVKNAEDFSFKAQAANYETMRAMFESFGAAKPVTTGIIQWMLNAAWPKIVWQLYDYYLVPNGAFYGAKKGSEKVLLSYNYADQGVYFVNNGLDDVRNASAEIRVFDMQSKEIFKKVLSVSIAPNESKKIMDLPVKEILAASSSTSVYFIDLSINMSGNDNHNFYWLSSTKDILNYEESDWYYTPITQYADFSSLSSLPNVPMKINSDYRKDGTDGILTVTLANPTDSIAFFIELSALDSKTDECIVPVFWDDNYISILPGETRVVSAHFSLDKMKGEKPLLKYKGWNVKN